MLNQYHHLPSSFPTVPTEGTQWAAHQERCEQPQRAAPTPPGESCFTSNDATNQPQRAAPPGPTSNDAPQTNNNALPGTINTHPKPLSRANIQIATLNVNGRASSSHPTRGPVSKWTNIHRVMREKKIDILCLQETHLENEHINQIHNLFGRRMLVINSATPNSPGATGGVAFVINKECLSYLSTETFEITPGRALLLTVARPNDRQLTLLNIYAPNAPHAHPTFWNEIQNKIPRQRSPDIVLGDFNLTEDPIDRAPAHTDNEPAAEALKIFKESLNIRDVWRHENPDTRLFTFSSSNGSLSRLDRIYTRHSLTNALFNW